MTNELIVDFAESVGAFASHLVDFVKDATADAKTGLRAGLGNRSQRRFRAVEHDTPPTPLHLAEQAVFDGTPLRGIGRIVGDAQTHAKSAGERDEVFLETSGACGVGATTIAERQQFGGVGIERLEIVLPGQSDRVAAEGAVFARGAECEAAKVARGVVDAVGDQGALAKWRKSDRRPPARRCRSTAQADATCRGAPSS